MSSLSAVFSSPTIGWAEVLLRLFVAAALGGAIGLEREIRERQAGLRTHLVVSVGAAVFTLVSAYGFANFGARVDPTRIAAQIVSGIGFLGAGAIIRQGLSVRGLTTAASLWLVAAIGMAAGAGFWAGAVIATVGALVTLGPLRVVAFRVLSRYRPQHDRLLVEIPAGGSPAPIIDAIERQGGRVIALDVAQEGDRRSVAVDVQLAREGAVVAVVAGVAEIDGVLEVQWTD
ncbi:MAG TPA: MgtC/SapB family protein [Gaiellaceae bacterium]|nr:MgtC/SapB family protein [Gaiellaceae bacterium]